MIPVVVSFVVYRDHDDRLPPSIPAKPGPVFDNFFRTPKPIRINTSKSLSKQTTLTMFRMNTYVKPEGVSGIVNQDAAEPSTRVVMHDVRSDAYLSSRPTERGVRYQNKAAHRPYR